MNEAYIEYFSRDRLKKIKDYRPTVSVDGKCYYVSAQGDDNNSGLSPEDALKTLSAVKSLSDKLTAGDAVLFRCGDIFRGGLPIIPGVTYSSYGTGDKPRLYGARVNAVTLEWKLIKENVYATDVTGYSDIGCIIFNEGESWGYKKLYEGDTDVLLEGDFYHDEKNSTLYLYTEKGNPATAFYDIEIGERQNIMYGKPDNSTIDGLVLKYTGAHGMGFSSLEYSESTGVVFNGLTGLTVRGCEFEWIGGSQLFKGLRYGNGFEIWGGCDNLIIENCYFNQIYDSALTYQYKGECRNPVTITNSVTRGNLFDMCPASYEYYLSEEADGKINPDSDFCFKNVEFSDNICRRSGYGWGMQRPDRTYACHVQSWEHYNKSENFVIKNNIFDRGDNGLLYISAFNEKWVPQLQGNVYCQYDNKKWITKNNNVSVFNSQTVKHPTENNAEADCETVFARR